MSFDKSVICPVIIGRDQDLQVMDQLIAQSRSAQNRIALISGEAGIGKSRFVKEALARAPKDTTVLEGSCFQNESTLPYAPLLDLFRKFLTTRPSDEVKKIFTAVALQLFNLLPELSSHLPNLTSAQTADPKQEKQRTFQALIHVFTQLTQTQPVIIVIEDLHWADSVSLEFFLTLTQRMSSMPVLVTITYRSDEISPEVTHFLVELDRGRLATEFTLKPMSQVEVAVMLQKTFELETPISREFLDVIFPLTEGNPFFIEEILKLLINEGDVFYANGAWDRKTINQLHIPRTIQDAVQTRTRKLDESTLRVLILASVMGRRFNFDLLQSLLGIGELELTTVLKQLLDAQLVIEESVDHFAFRHALIREATYATLLLRERKSLHRRVAEALESLHAGSFQSQLADLSYHFFIGELWQKALKYSKSAGDQACTLYAQREAIIYYSRALIATHQLDQIADPALLRARGNAYELLGDFNLALDDFEQALQVAQATQNGLSEWQTLMDMGFLWAGRDYQKAGEYFRRAEVQAQKLGESKLHTQSLNRLGNLYINMGQIEQGLTTHMRALEIFENADDQQGMAETYDLIGMATLQRGDQVGAYAEYQQAIRLFRKLDDKRGLISALTIASVTSYWDETDRIHLESLEENQRLVLEALELARQIDWKAGQSIAQWCLALSLAHRGVFGEAHTYARDALQIAVEIDHRQWIVGAYYALGCTYALMLQGDLAIQNLEKGLLLARELSSAWWIGNLTASLANAYLLNTDIDHARSLIESAAIKNKGPHTLVERRILLVKGNLYLTEGRPAEALDISERLLNAVGNKNQPKPIPALLKLKGEAEMALRQWHDAEQDLEQAKQTAEERQAFPILWQIHRSLGALHKKQKQKEDMDREFKSARQILQQLAANIGDNQLQTDFIRLTDKFLPQESKIAKRRSAAEKFGGLTPREQEVMRFLSQGKTNREIAEELIISERTVENHVANILNKLGFDSRAQAAVWAVEKGLGVKN